MKFMLCFLFLCMFDEFITVKCVETENSSSRELDDVSDEVSDEVTEEVTGTVTAEVTEEDERDSDEMKRATSNENDDSEVAVEDVTGSIEEPKNSNQDLSNYDNNNSEVDRVNDNHASIEQYDTSKDRSSSDSNEKRKQINNDHSDENSQSQSDEMNPVKNPVWLGEANPQYLYEQLNGHKADAFGTNQHYSYPSIYKDLGRRFVLQYPYEEVSKNKETKITQDKLITIKEAKLIEEKLIPIKAPPDLVLAVAKESALLESAKPKNPTDELIKKEALRTGEYWDGIWKEDMDSKLLRSKQKVLKSKKNKFNIRPIKKTSIKPKLGSIRAKVMPGSNLYGLISVLKEYSPRLLYVVNKNKI